jgi:hypothetical protein
MKNIYGIIRNRRGSSFPLTVAIALALIIILSGISEYMRLMIIASDVREAVQSAVISAVNDNYDNVFPCVREGYAGGYIPVDTAWQSSVDYGDVYECLDEKLGLKKENSQHVKYAGEALEFQLSGLSIEINNTTLAPNDSTELQSFLADVAIQLEVPVSFAARILPPMRINLRVQAKYMPMF